MPSIFAASLRHHRVFSKASAIASISASSFSPRTRAFKPCSRGGAASCRGDVRCRADDISTKKFRELTNEPSAEMVPSWSRDGRWIYFASERSGGWEIWKMPSAGGPAVQVTNQGGYAAFESLDGKFLSYEWNAAQE